MPAPNTKDAMQYEALAPMYDRLMCHVEYDEWSELVVKIINRYCGAERPAILELGAGTGVIGAFLSGLGHDYIASDLSFSMCKVASENRGLTTCVADARRLPFKKKFDMVMFLYDGINYLFTQEDYRRLFASVHDILTPDGIFLFDVTTRENSTRHFENYFDYDDYGDFSYARHSYFDRKKSVQHNDFTIFCESEKQPGYYEKFVERHKQKVYSVDEIERMIPKKRFEILGEWDGYSFKKYSSKSLRVHFLLRKI